MEIKELYWVAGLIEGEGCFLHDNGRRGNSILRFALTSTEKKVVQHAKKIVGIGYINGPFWNKKSTKPFWVWAIDRDSDVAALMMTVYPLMWDNRQERIEDLLELWRTAPVVRRK